MQTKDGLTLRTALEGDLEQIGALLADRGDEADAQDLRLVVDDVDEGLGAVSPEQAPVSKRGSGVPPDALAPLVLGPFGAAGLEDRHGDVLLGRQRELMEALFPPVTSDVLTFYLAF